MHNLVKSYVRECNNIILLIVPMNNDRDNCHAGKLVEAANALDRTIGVLTKPDRLEKGIRLDSWTSLLAGKTYILGHGYYVTRQPSPEELKQISRMEAMENEVRFFKTDKRWTTDFKEFQLNFGAPKIQKKLGELLVDKIKGIIPQVAVQIDEKLHEILQGLARLPPPPGDKAMNIVFSTLNKIEQNLITMFSGNVDLELFHNCRKLVHELSGKLNSISPALTLPAPLWELSSGDEVDSQAPTTSSTKNKKRSAAQNIKTPSPKKPKRESTISELSDSHPAINYTIDDLRELRAAVDVSGISNAVDSRAMKKPIDDTMYYWEQPIAHFVDEVNKLISESITNVLDRNLSAWATTPFAQQVHAFAAETMLIIKDEIAKDAQRALYAERSSIMIFDADYFDYIKSKEMSRLEKLPGGEVLKPLPPKGAVARVTFMPELDLFCSIKAYLYVCNMSLTHRIAKHVLSIFSQIQTQIMAHFHNKLELEVGDVMKKCQSLLEEDERRAHERTRLENEKKRWEKAASRLREVLRQ